MPKNSYRGYPEQRKDRPKVLSCVPLEALDSDHEPDMHGHSASSHAATALDNILGADETRSWRSGAPDLDRLRRLAAERFEQWSRDRAEPGT